MCIIYVARPFRSCWRRPSVRCLFLVHLVSMDDSRFPSPSPFPSPPFPPREESLPVHVCTNGRIVLMIMMRTIDFFFCVFFFFFRVFRFFPFSPPTPFPPPTLPLPRLLVFFPALDASRRHLTSRVTCCLVSKKDETSKAVGCKGKEKRAVTQFERELGSVSESEHQGMEGEFSMP